MSRERFELRLLRLKIGKLHHLVSRGTYFGITVGYLNIHLASLPATYLIEEKQGENAELPLGVRLSYLELC